VWIGEIDKIVASHEVEDEIAEVQAMEEDISPSTVKHTNQSKGN
jgi:beta-lactamase superfamily II metal-dependent hydrolase